MQRTFSSIGALLVIFSASAGASDADALIALDKQWGESGVKGDTTVAAKLLADQVLSVTPDGVEWGRRKSSPIIKRHRRVDVMSRRTTKSPL